MKSCYWLVFSLFISIHIPLSAEAQITVDGTTDTTLTPTDNGVRIDRGDRVGNNLFHSFDEFSIPDGGSASFNNAAEIENIFSRVTGGNISNINGLISANGGANLLLINPAGIVFGENASLNIGGSFFATTADSLLFEDGEFSAVNPQAVPLLTINRPIGLNFGNSPEDIINRANSNQSRVATFEQGDRSDEVTINTPIGLEVDSGKNLTLVGGNIALEGSGLTAPGGRVELGGLSTVGIVAIKDNGSLVFPSDIAKANVSLTNDAEVNVSAEGGGSINVNASNLILSEGSELFAGIAENMGSSESQAGDILITADESVQLIGNGIDIEGLDTVISNHVGLSAIKRENADADSNAIGDSGAIFITTDRLELSERATISAITFGRGNAGKIEVNANTVEMSGFSEIATRVRAGANGSNGNVELNVNLLSLNDGLIISDIDDFGQEDARTTFSDGGDVIINAVDAVRMNTSEAVSLILAQVQENGVGNAGNIEINTGTLSLVKSSLILATNAGTGDAGNITFNVQNSVLLEQNALVLSQLLNGAEGNAGDIEINANSLAVRDGSLILSDSQGTGSSGNVTLNIAETIVLEGISEAGFQSQIVAGLSRPSSQGTGGVIEINARELTLNDLAFITSNSVPDSVGSAGAILINVDRLQLNDNSLINVFTGNSDDGGSITINAKSLALNSGGKILAATDGAGNAGSINLNISDRLTIDNSVEASAPFIVSPESPLLNDLQSEPSGIYANTTANSTGDGGNIVVMGIDRIPSEFTIANDAQIIASSEGTGSGGSIFLNSQSLELDNNATISASTNFDRGGNVTLQIADNIILRNNSSISALATNDADGGNINIDTDFILAFTNQNNDIVANARRGSGGNINITAESILGIEERSSNPLNNTNDLDVSSDLSIDGTITINNPNVDRTSGLVELSAVPIDAEAILAQDLCRVENENVAGGSSFIITGRGGLTPTSAESLSNLNRVVEWSDLAELEVSGDGRVAVGRSPIPQAKQPNYRQSQGLMVADDGSLWLSADASKTIPQNSTIVHPECHS